MCALYALCTGAAAHRHYNCKKSKSRSGTVKDNKTVYISLEALVYNPFHVNCRELAPGTVSLTGDRAKGDDSKHDSHYSTSER